MKWVAVAFALSATAANAAPPPPPVVHPTASEVFEIGPKDTRIHVASGFACPNRVGRYVRDAVGERDLNTGSDFCSYYALDGVYGTVTLTPVRGSYNPESSLSSQFIQQEGIGAKEVGQKTVEVGPKGHEIKVYTRTYQTSRLETLHYLIEFTGAAVGKWVVETTIEYAEPRDDALAKYFLNWAYDSALKRIKGKAEAAK